MNFWLYFFLIFVGVMTEKIYQYLRSRVLLPYRFKCPRVDCGFSFKTGSMRTFDLVKLSHEEQHEAPVKMPRPTRYDQ